MIDLGAAYLKPESPLYAGIERALESAVRVTSAARVANIPIIFTNVEYQPGGADGGVFFRKIPALKVFEKGSPLGAFPAALSPVDGDFVITKRYASAFFLHAPVRHADIARRRYCPDLRNLYLWLRAATGIRPRMTQACSTFRQSMPK